MARQNDPENEFAVPLGERFAKKQASETERVRKAGVRTAVRTRQVVPERIQSRTPASGVVVTRPTENRFVTGPNVTGVNELEELTR